MSEAHYSRTILFKRFVNFIKEVSAVPGGITRHSQLGQDAIGKIVEDGDQVELWVQYSVEAEATPASVNLPPRPRQSGVPSGPSNGSNGRRLATPGAPSGTISLDGSKERRSGGDRDPLLSLFIKTAAFQVLAGGTEDGSDTYGHYLQVNDMRETGRTVVRKCYTCFQTDCVDCLHLICILLHFVPCSQACKSGFSYCFCNCCHMHHSVSALYFT
jgi:hypothetical protein